MRSLVASFRDYPYLWGAGIGLLIELFALHGPSFAAVFNALVIFGPLTLVALTLVAHNLLKDRMDRYLGRTVEEE